MVTRFAVAALVAVLLDCGCAYAQVGGMSISPGPPLGFTSPLGVGPGSPVAPTRIPMGSTELAAPAVSPLISGTSPMSSCNERRHDMRRFVGGNVCRHGRFSDVGGVWLRNGGLRRRRYDRKRVGHLCRERRLFGGIRADGLVRYGNRVELVCRSRRHSVGLYRNGRRRPQPSIRCSDHESIGASYDADPPRCDAPFQFVGARFDVGQHGPMPDDRDGYPHGWDTADYGERVRSPFGRQRLRLGVGSMRCALKNGINSLTGGWGTQDCGCRDSALSPISQPDESALAMPRFTAVSRNGRVLINPVL